LPFPHKIVFFGLLHNLLLIHPFTFLPRLRILCNIQLFPCTEFPLLRYLSYVCHLFTLLDYITAVVHLSLCNYVAHYLLRYSSAVVHCIISEVLPLYSVVRHIEQLHIYKLPFLVFPTDLSHSETYQPQSIHILLMRGEKYNSKIFRYIFIILQRTRVVLFTMELYCTPKVNTLQLNTVGNSPNTRTRPTRAVS
jgi:hypothetical protein